jgi:hypothetical protein
MCLLASKQATREYKKIHQNNTITAYKIVNNYAFGKYKSLYMDAPIPCDGEYVSDRLNNTFPEFPLDVSTVKEFYTTDYVYVYNGIHVFLTYSSVEEYMDANPPTHICENPKVIKVECNIDDFVACNKEHTEAVFMKVTVGDIVKDV